MATDLKPVRSIEPRPEFAGILRDDLTLLLPDEDRTSESSSERINGWFDRLMVQSGLEVPASTYLMLALLSGLAGGGMMFVIAEDLLSATLGSTIGMLIPIGVALMLRSRRQKRILQQLPSMIEELARTARTGRSLEQCLYFVSDDTPEPLGAELQRCKRKMQLGLGLSAALKELPERTGVTTMNILAMALVVHQQTGGDLVRVLERLSQTVRDRLQFLGRLRAATTASRATALLMILLPPGILAFFVFRDPTYLTTLMDSVWGRRVTLMAVGLQVLGSAWVLRILKFSQRT